MVNRGLASCNLVASLAMLAIATDELSESTLALAASAAFPKSPELAKGADRKAEAKSDLMSPMYASRRAKTILE
jgi:hypothetical protein